MHCGHGCTNKNDTQYVRSKFDHQGQTLKIVTNPRLNNLYVCGKRIINEKRQSEKLYLCIVLKAISKWI